MSFSIGNKFRAAAEVSNSIPLEKFPQILTRVTKKLHLKNERLFSEEEEIQLRGLFDLSEDALDLVLSASCYIFEQAAFTGSGPDALYNILVEAGFDEDHAKSIGRIWANEGADYVSKLKSRQLGAAALVDTDYHLNLNMSARSLQRLQEPTAIFELSISDSQACSDETMTNKLGLEFGHEQLYTFFNDLEKVQQHLDKLT
jgi:COMM domain containing 10